MSDLSLNKPSDSTSELEADLLGIGEHQNYTFYRIRMIVSSIRLVPHILVMLGTRNNIYLKSDLARWAEMWHLKRPQRSIHFVKLLVIFMTFAPEFRNIFYMRLGIKGKIFSWMCSPRESLEIATSNIGPGLYIQHGIATLISAQSIGINCWINQQVTIGYSNRTDRPIIGNNVRICAGAKIVGNIRVGDDATVGINTVVINDVAPATTVFGVPGRVVWRLKRFQPD